MNYCLMTPVFAAPPYICYVTLPGGSCFGSYGVSTTVYPRSLVSFYIGSNQSKFGHALWTKKCSNLRLTFDNTKNIRLKHPVLELLCASAELKNMPYLHELALVLPDEGGGETKRGTDRPHELCLQRAAHQVRENGVPRYIYIYFFLLLFLYKITRVINPFVRPSIQK